MDLWTTFVSVLPVVSGYLPVQAVDVVTNVVGGAAIIASVFVPTNNRILSRVRQAVNLLGFNFGKATNKD